MLERWNAALDYIEDNLDHDIDPAQLARITLTSDYHFRRVFSALAGIPLSAYIRQRRMSLAAADILAGIGVLDVATKYGYSGDAFTRAFRDMHGVTPSHARKPGTTLRSRPPLAFHLTIEGKSTMDYRITELPAFHIIGKSTRIPLTFHGENTAMTQFHQTLPTGFGEQLRRHADLPELPHILFVSDGFEADRTDGSLFDYYFAVATTAPIPADLDSLSVPASTWAVFETRSDTALAPALQQLWADAFSEWFPSHPFHIAPGPEILTVTENTPDWSSGAGELWIPVARNQ